MSEHIAHALRQEGVYKKRLAAVVTAAAGLLTTACATIGPSPIESVGPAPTLPSPVRVSCSAITATRQWGHIELPSTQVAGVTSELGGSITKAQVEANRYGPVWCPTVVKLGSLVQVSGVNNSSPDCVIYTVAPGDSYALCPGGE